MQQAYVVTGTLTDGNNLVLDEAVPITTGRVRLVIEVLSPAPATNFRAVLDGIHERLQASGHKPPTPEEVRARVRAERDNWGDEDADLP